jgi:hypothetical protein
MPTFKTNIDLQTNQLLNAVMHNLPVMPSNPLEGQMYYNTGKKTAYIWNGSYWAVWGGTSAGQEIKQFSFIIQSPIGKTGALLVRLYQPLTLLRIDSVITSGLEAIFNIEHRSTANVPGTNITSSEIVAVETGTETTVFDTSDLIPDYWLYINIVNVSVTTGLPVEGGTGVIPGDGGTVGVLTITITCTTG